MDGFGTLKPLTVAPLPMLASFALEHDNAISDDFFNEPAYINRDHWNEIIRELTAVIRSVDKKHMVVWESADGWAQPSWCLWMRPSGDPNTLYGFRRYRKHRGYAHDEYYPGYKCSQEEKHFEPWLEAILSGIRHNVPIHCGEFGISIIQPDDCAARWLDDYLAFSSALGSASTGGTTPEVTSTAPAWSPVGAKAPMSPWSQNGSVEAVGTEPAGA